MKDEINALRVKITKSLLKIVSHKFTVIVIAEIQTYTTDDLVTVPVLDFFGARATKEKDGFDLALERAVEHDEYGYLDDVLDHTRWLENDINMQLEYYPEWPEDLDNSNIEVILMLKKIVAGNIAYFSRIEKFYFHYSDSTKFTTIIDK